MASWDFRACFEPILANLEDSLNADTEFKACAVNNDTRFSVLAADTGDFVLVSVNSGIACTEFANTGAAPRFTLSARSQDWQRFFQPVPKAPFQSYWGILRAHGHTPGVGISGDLSAFGTAARLWRIFLDKARAQLHQLQIGSADQDLQSLPDEDHIVGKYLWLQLPVFGKTKIFYERSGHGPRAILWLHTAGADSRQFHELMNDQDLRQRYTMYAFDMPGHGRSFPGSRQIPLGYANDEDTYVGAIKQVIKALRLRQPIVSGASMAGHVCLAVALKAQELGVRGVVPVEAAAHLPLIQPPYELSGHLNESVINPERVCGMIAPTTSSFRRGLIWWIYSSQAAGVFQGDLKFYFRGWDVRDRLGAISTDLCPVYMLTGEYDYSCPPEVSAATASEIRGARFERMHDMGHFPMTENPEGFIVYFNRALEFIEKQRAFHEEI